MQLQDTVLQGNMVMVCIKLYHSKLYHNYLYLYVFYYLYVIKLKYDEMKYTRDVL